VATRTCEGTRGDDRVGRSVERKRAALLVRGRVGVRVRGRVGVGAALLVRGRVRVGARAEGTREGGAPG
jgi:hypothetical protein